MRGLTLSPKEERRAYVLNRVLDQHASTGEAATVLGVSERQVWRLLAAYRKEGVAAVVHGNRGHTPKNATPQETRERVVRLAQGPYDGANCAHLAELLAEREGLTLSRWTVRRVLCAGGVALPPKGRRRTARHRSRRERMVQEGMLLQVDGSRHRWLGPDRPFLTLVGAIDDATGTVPYALFREQEDAQGYLLMLREVVRGHGVPLALYSDRHSIFHRAITERETIEEELSGRRELTQVGRALEELGIELVLAHSPQAKGRIERLWQTFQSRLVVELRLAGATTLEDAQRVVNAFLPRFNARFGVPAREAGTAYRPPPEGMDLDGVLCFTYQRTVAADNTVSFGGASLQLAAAPERVSYARTRVEVQERLDGSLVVRHAGKVVATTPAPAAPVTLRARKGPRGGAGSNHLGGQVSPEAQGRGAEKRGLIVEARPDPVGAKPPPKPAANHPWRRTGLTKSLLPTTDRIAAP